MWRCGDVEIEEIYMIEEIDLMDRKRNKVQTYKHINAQTYKPGNVQTHQPGPTPGP